MIAAFILYYLDRHYRLNDLYARSKDEFGHIKDSLRTDPADEDSPIDAFWILILSLLILSFVLALKRVLDKRRQEQIEKGEIEDVSSDEVLK